MRGETFVTRKITRAAARIKLGLQEKLYLGNLAARRDWGFAGDYVEAMWMILQHDHPDDFVIATGEDHSVREFVEQAFRVAGIELRWQGNGVNEKGLDSSSGKVLVVIDPRYFRPTEVDILVGDSSKAQKELGWRPGMGFQELVTSMVQADLHLNERELHLKDGGFEVRSYHE
jgi:GDPmannose 4,6-dehydratase